MQKSKPTTTIPPAKLLQELKKGMVHPVYLLLGEERGGKEEFIRHLQRRLSCDSTDRRSMNTTVYHGDDAIPEEIVENLNTYSFFSGRKLAVVHDFDRMKSSRAVPEYLGSPNVGAVLVLLSDKKSVSKQVMELVEQHGRVSIFWPMFRHEGERWVAEKLQELGITADRETVRYIVELSGTGMEDLNNQILSIRDYLGEGEKLTLEKARSIVSSIYNHTVFDLVQSLFQKPPGEMISIYRKLIDNGEFPSRILFSCIREILKIFSVYALKKGGYDFPWIVKKLGLRKMEAERIQKIVGRVNLRTFRALFAAVTKLDYTMKSSPAELGEVEFERFLAELLSYGGN